MLRLRIVGDSMIQDEQRARRPEDVGIDSERLERVFARARRDVDLGVVPSCQVAIAREGKIAGLRSFGRAVHAGVERPVGDDTLYTVFSCTKAIVAAAIWMLLEDGRLRIEERVASIIPEFGTNGKDIVTVEQVLLHTGGFPYAPYRPEHWDDRDQRLAAFHHWRLAWEPGSRFEYHPTSGHWVLAEIIERRSGMGYRDLIRQRITAPLGLAELFVGLPSGYGARVADARQMVPPVEPPGGWRDVTPDALLELNRPELRAIGLPGGGAVTGAGELALFYQALLHGGQGASGARILAPQTIELARVVRSRDFHRDPVLGTPVNRGLSIVVAGDDGNAHFRGFGHKTSPQAFGHGGAGGQIAWGDPSTGVSVAYLTNGFIDWLAQGRRITAISSLAAECAR